MEIRDGMVDAFLGGADLVHAVKEAVNDPLRHHDTEHGAFGTDRFGELAERIARLLGTPRYIVGQSAIVACWIILNCVGIGFLHWDPYPFILLNLAFSTQAAYAAPLILLAQTRQADRDKHRELADAKHREELADQQFQLLEANTQLTREVHTLTAEIYKRAAVEVHQHFPATPKPRAKTASRKKTAAKTSPRKTATRRAR